MTNTSGVVDPSARTTDINALEKRIGTAPIFSIFSHVAARRIPINGKLMGIAPAAESGPH